MTPSENAVHGTAQERANIGKEKPINEYTLDGKFVRTWKSIKAISDFFESLYPEFKFRDFLDKIIYRNSIDGREKSVFAERIFMRYNDSIEDMQFIVSSATLRKFKNVKIPEGYIISDKYIYDEMKRKLDYIQVITEMLSEKKATRIVQRKALEYAIECMKKEIENKK